MKKVKVVATEQVKKWASQAVEMQGGCNGAAFARILVEVMTYFRGSIATPQTHGQEHWGGDMSHQNPITKLILHKLYHLARLEQDTEFKSMHDCMDLQDGKDVEIEIIPL